MRNLTLTVVFILISSAAILAQDSYKLGDISQQEVDLKQCEFDKDANAIILIHEANSNYDDEGHLITVHHIKLKILKDAGLDAANIAIEFYRKNDFEYIDKIEAVTINVGPNGTVTKDKLDKGTVYTKEINKRIGEVIFAFPSARAGSILDYKYRSTMKHYGGLDYWDFQDELPVVASKYNLVILPNTEFAYRINKRKDLNVSVEPNASKGSIYFEMKNIPGLRKEPYMDARKDYLQKVIFQLSGYRTHDADKNEYMTSWEAVSKELLKSEDFGEQLKKSVRADELSALLLLKPTPEEKMNTVYNYVRRNMSWNGLNSKYSIDGIKEAWKKKTGTSGDINLLLVNLLRDAGLDAYPMLVSERHNGKVNTDYPFIDQFNAVFACVKINSKNYYLDATDAFTPSHIIPYDILNTTAFIVDKGTGELIDISNDSLQYRESVSTVMEIKTDGSVKGNVTVKSEDYARTEKMAQYADEKDKLKNSYFNNEGFQMDITNFMLKNREKDSLPLEQQMEFTGRLGSTGEYRFIPLNFLPGFTKNPFISDNRFTNINFGYARNISLMATIQLPPDLVPDNLPKAVKMITPDENFVYRRRVEYDSVNNLVTCNMEFVFKNSLVDANDYLTVKDIYKKLFGYLKEPVLLKKK